MITTRNKRLIQESLRSLAEKHSAVVDQLEHTMAVLAGVLEIDDAIALTESAGPPHAERGAAPVADQKTMSIHWRGKSCQLGNTLLFWFFERLVRSPNQYVSHVDLLESVWDGQREGATIRGVAKRLRDRLAAAGMADLAEAIDGSVSGYYGLILV